MDIFLLIILIIINIILLFLVLKNGTGILFKQQEKLEKTLKDEIAQNRTEINNSLKQNREELNNNLSNFSDRLINQFKIMADTQKNLLDTFSTQLKNLTESNVHSLNNLQESVITQMKVISDMQKNQLENFANQLSKLSETNEQELNKMRETIENKLSSIQKDNNEKLEQMRATVDEKLHNTLEKRLGESFNTVSQRLESLYKQLGEVQSLSNGVNDLKKALTNIKTRGTWGEIALGNIIEDILTPEQYETNVITKSRSNERVEYAVKLPGHNDDNTVYLPIDAKFPQEDYQKLLDAEDEGNKEKINELHKQLEKRIRQEAKDICEKYLDPPNTTDFGIMFMPTESLYAEILKIPGLWDQLQREYKVVITGPTTLAALLNSLQMGFKTLAIQKRSSEVWNLLGAVKTEFGKFKDILLKTQKKLQEASNTIDTATKKTITIERKLNNIQQLPETDSKQLLEDDDEISENITA